MIFDIIVLGALFVSAIIAFLRGFIREVLTIVGVVGGLAASVYFGPMVKPQMRAWFGVKEGDEEPARLFDIAPLDIIADVVSYAAVFVLVVIILSILSHFISKAVNSIGLGPVDRTLGVAFGLARGLVLLGILYIPVDMMVEPETKAEWFKDSRTHGYVELTARELKAFLPEDKDGELKKKMKDGQSAISETRQRLEDIDLLKKAGEAAGGAENDEEPARVPLPDGAPAPEGGGYQPGERQEMKHLIEEQAEPHE